MKYWSDHEQCFIFDRRAAYFKSDFPKFNSKGPKWTAIEFLTGHKNERFSAVHFKFVIFCVNLEKPIFCFYQTGHKIQRTEAGSKIKILFRP